MVLVYGYSILFSNPIYTSNLQTIDPDGDSLQREITLWNQGERTHKNRPSYAGTGSHQET